MLTSTLCNDQFNEDFWRIHKNSSLLYIFGIDHNRALYPLFFWTNRIKLDAVGWSFINQESTSIGL